MKLENKFPYKLDLQFFAEPGEGGEPGGDNPGASQGKVEKESQKY